MVHDRSPCSVHLSPMQLMLVLQPHTTVAGFLPLVELDRLRSSCQGAGGPCYCSSELFLGSERFFYSHLECPGMDGGKERGIYHSHPRSPWVTCLSISSPASVYLNAGSATQLKWSENVPTNTRYTPALALQPDFQTQCGPSIWTVDLEEINPCRNCTYSSCLLSGSSFSTTCSTEAVTKNGGGWGHGLWDRGSTVSAPEPFGYQLEAQNTRYCRDWNTSTVIPQESRLGAEIDSAIILHRASLCVALFTPAMNRK